MRLLDSVCLTALTQYRSISKKPKSWNNLQCSLKVIKHWYNTRVSQTDGRTDGWTDRQNCLSILCIACIHECRCTI